MYRLDGAFDRVEEDPEGDGRFQLVPIAKKGGVQAGSRADVGRPADAAAAGKAASAQAANVHLGDIARSDRGGRSPDADGRAVTAAPDVTDAVRLLASRRFALCVVDLADDRAAIGAIRVLRS